MADAAQVNDSLIASGQAITKLLGEYDPAVGMCAPIHDVQTLPLCAYS
jgi:hypothetical protein